MNPAPTERGSRGTTLVAVAHGSRNPAATATIHALGDEVRRQRPGLRMVTCFLDHAPPSLRQVVAELDAPAVVVPLLLTAAYHSDVDIPTQLGGSSFEVVQSKVLGPDPLLVAALERRLDEVGVAAGDRGTAVVLGAAGSSAPSAIEAVRRLAREWERRGWWAVEAAFASAAAPTISEAVATLRDRGAPRVAVATYLLSPGLFGDQMRTAGADVVSGALGAAPEVATLVLRRFDEATGSGDQDAPPGRG